MSCVSRLDENIFFKFVLYVNNDYWQINQVYFTSLFGPAGLLEGKWSSPEPLVTEAKKEVFLTVPQVQI